MSRGRWESDGCISVMENSNDEDPWSPVVLGIVDTQMVNLEK